MMQLLPFYAVLILAGISTSWIGDYGVGLLLGMASAATLASAWALFSGPTRYISLATVAFYGICAYVVAVFAETQSWPVILLIAAAFGAGVALVVGLSTLRLAGIYFVIFSFGLAELIRQLITWFEVNVTGTLGRYIFTDFQPKHLLWQLLALLAVTLTISVRISRSRLGLALKVIGDDETVAAHAGINLARTKLLLFVISAVLITLAGAIQSPRWVYIEPSIVFNPTVSFTAVIMALLGGANRIWGPILGAVPLYLGFEFLSTHFPDHFSILLGLLFILVVFALPNGVLAAIEKLGRRKGGVA
ncbi:branched-chain amino acid ABC transporter permease [Paracoccus sp. MBLB3053]|uniref:Branched-chain amino acid ABC transporter permease n=1 Tax=Paracoccus aurantius TaxID=3073814 RepID=A0ABU2HX15_9RHOB|nr:branched-chain amino acid ABC transporter permease [Paracoccus sp. MBLB3053]MDS9469591.1 branched-chain amino acid ABC transporter permease [Paracoccus sp. MBLB3053]